MPSVRRIPTFSRVIEVTTRLRSIATLGERLEMRLERMEDRLDALAVKVEGGDSLASALEQAKATPAYFAAYDLSEPLVTVCMATYNRAELLTSRALPSLLCQHYKNLQIVVIGDACSDDTEARVAKIRDSRITFFNLPERGRYPAAPELRWMVAGTAAMNEALRRAEGHFVTHLDDDDENMPERVSRLVERARQTQADLVFHPFWVERPEGWRLREAKSFQRQEVGTGSIFYHRFFAGVPWDIDAYRLREPGDWHRLRKFKYMGAVAEREPTPLARYYWSKG